jgi:aspartate carbamoyltransferase catalytic subunit
MKGLLTLKQLETNKIIELIEYAIKLKNGYIVKYPDKKVATLFFENSTRTHYSFQTALMNLGIKVLSCDVRNASVAKGETLYDTVRVFESFGVDGVVIRSSVDEYFKELENIQIPIFNGGDGKTNHPTQSLLDLMTIYEEFGRFEGLKCCIVGDIAHSRVAHTNIEVMERLGMEVYITGPSEYNDNSAKFIPFDEAVKTMDVMMLLRVQFERHQESMSLTIEEYNKQCLKAHRNNGVKLIDSYIDKSKRLDKYSLRDKRVAKNMFGENPKRNFQKELDELKSNS